jgi:hypothetical protein
MSELAPEIKRTAEEFETLEAREAELVDIETRAAHHLYAPKG